MTALTSAQMRALVDECDDCGGTLAECKAARVACCPDCQHFKPRIVALRAALEDSPHDSACGKSSPWEWIRIEEPCTCWKADAL